MLRRILKIAVISGAGLAALVIATLWFFSSYPGENIIKNYAAKTIEKRAGLTVTIGRLETNLFSRIQLDETTVISPMSFNSDSLLYVDKIEVTYSIFDLLFGETNLESVIVDKVNLNISVDSLGDYGIPLLDTAEVAVSEEEKPSISISVNSAVLTDINVAYADERIPINIRLYHFSSHISGYDINEYSGRIHADSVLTIYENSPYRLKDLNCDFAWNGDRLSISSTADIEDLHLALSSSLRLPEIGDLELNASLEGDPSGLLDKIRNKYELPDAVVDNLKIKMNARGSIDSPEIDLSVSSRNGSIENIDLDSLRLYARYSSDRVSIDTAKVDLLGGYIIAQGSIPLKEMVAAVMDMRIEGINLSALWPTVYESESPFNGNLEGSVQAKGKIDAVSGWDVNGNLVITGLQYQGHPTADLDLRFSIVNDSSQLTLVHAGDTVRATALLKDGNIDGEFYANIPEISSISRFADIPDLKGNINAEGTFAGSLNNPVIAARVKGGMISYQNFPIDRLTADILYRDSSILINHLMIAGIRPESDMYKSILGMDSLYGTFDYACDLRGSSDSLEGDFLARIYSLSYSGYNVDSAFASVEIGGSNVSLDELHIYYNDLIVESSGSYDTVSARGNLETEIFSSSRDGNDMEDDLAGDIVNINRGTIRTEFDLSDDNDMRFNIDCDSIWVGLLKSFIDIEVPNNGFINLKLDIEGNLQNPAGNLSARAYSIEHPSYEIDSVIVAAELDGGHLHLGEFQLFAYDNFVSAKTDIYLDRGLDDNLFLSEESAIAGAMIMDSLDLSILKPYVAPTGEIRGVSSANITWDGTVKNPGVKGWVNINDGYLKYMEDATPLDQIYLRLNLSDSVFSIDSASCFSAGTPLSVRGTVRYDFSNNYELSADLSVYDIVLLTAAGKITKDDLDLRIFSDNFDLEILKPFVAIADSLGGSLKSEVSIAGKTGMPDVTGYIRIDGFSLFSSELSAIIESGLLDVKFDKTRIDIDSLSVDINGGSMALRGFLVQDAGTLTDINLNLKASDISYEKADIFKGELQFADLKYYRKEDQYFLDGDISFGESRLVAKFPLKSILPWARSVETVEYEFPDIVARTRLNVRFRENDDLWIDNNLANIRMKAELGIIGTPVRPNLSGPISIEEGYLIYLDRRFKVETGNLYFGDPLKFNPEITLLAKTQVTEYQRTVADKYAIYIKVEGNLEEPRPDIYSEPPLDKSDIVALLTLGTTRSRLAGDKEDQGGIRNVLVERASRLTSDRVSGYISDKVGSMFGFDEFTVEGNLFQFDSSWGPRLVASRRISRRVELTYSTTVGHLNDQGVRLGYQLTPRISIQGETNQAGRSGIDLRYGLKFK
jgi:autotransporter translocation and assembly factor TamB